VIRLTQEKSRKPHVSVDSDRIIELIEAVSVPVDVTDVAEHFGISLASARRKLDGGVARGKLIQDKYDEEGHRLPFEHYRYMARED
jgi:predicted ArsR family transcriptional regulator